MTDTYQLTLYQPGGTDYAPLITTGTIGPSDGPALWHKYIVLFFYVSRFSSGENWVKYSVIHNSIAPSKELCSKMALGEVGVSLP